MLVVSPLLAAPRWPKPRLLCPLPSSALKTYALRLRPGDDLRQQLTAFAQAHHIAGRHPDHLRGQPHGGHAAAGQPGRAHRYTGAISKLCRWWARCPPMARTCTWPFPTAPGRTIGGHLLDGCRVYTTAEIVLGELPAAGVSARTRPHVWLQGAGGAARSRPEPEGPRAKRNKHLAPVPRQAQRAPNAYSSPHEHCPPIPRKPPPSAARF